MHTNIEQSSLKLASLNPTYYVLHRRSYRESSQILDLFCEKQGRFSALYRVNKKQPPLQPFIPYQMQFSGRGDLKYCQHVEINYPDDSSRGLVLKGKNMYCGFYLNELIMRLTWKGELQTELFRVYQQTLQGLLLLEDDQQSEPYLRRFEFHLLTLLGYQYNWLQDCDCRDIQPQNFYRFDPQVGFKIIESNAYDMVMRPEGFPGDAILAIAADNWQHKMSWQVAKQIARLALQPLLGGKPLISRTLFQKV
ncbi:MAG: DNA repair protein RecO [Oleispira sp.]|nr:DNA repair protein RecO [Oleispira sp.]